MSQATPADPFAALGCGRGRPPHLWPSFGPHGNQVRALIDAAASCSAADRERLDPESSDELVQARKRCWSACLKMTSGKEWTDAVGEELVRRVPGTRAGWTPTYRALMYACCALIAGDAVNDETRQLVLAPVEILLGRPWPA